MTSILVYVPTIDDAMQPETLPSINAQDMDGLTVEVGRHNPYPGDKRRNLLAQQQRARTMMLDGGYDALVFVEHDMQIPAHAIRTLYGTDAPVVYGAYMLRHRSYKVNALQYVNERNLGESLTQHPAELRRAMLAGVWQVSGIGFGCTLIRRRVMEHIGFHREIRDREPYADRPFAKDCLRIGYTQLARFDVSCLHYCEHDAEWLEIGGGMSDIVKVTAAQNVTAQVAGASMAMVEGELYEIPRADANELARAGYVTIDAPKAKAKAAAKSTRKPAAKARK